MSMMKVVYPFYFLQSIYLYPLDSIFIVEGSILNTNMWFEEPSTTKVLFNTYKDVIEC